uniref:Uncharacterized protein n=1 Tax=Glossina austeni TaxID=7395 RepID=A0A1A9UM52_GLOAU
MPTNMRVQMVDSEMIHIYITDMENKRKICDNYSDIESSSDELDFEVCSEHDINNIDALSSDNADNIELSHESDSNDNTTFPESDAGENVEGTTCSHGNGEWTDVSEVDNIPSPMDFDISPRIAGPHISNDIKEPLDFFRLYFTDALIDSRGKVLQKLKSTKNTRIEVRLKKKKDVRSPSK